MFLIDDAILTAVIGGVSEALAGMGLGLLHGDPEKRAFRIALSAAIGEFDRDHPDWSVSLFDKQFLTGQAMPILARALVRSAEPTADQLASAYAEQFHIGRGRDDLVQRFTPLAAEFLLRFDIALRRQPAFREHFDSQAMDRTAVYVYQLLLQVRADWATERSYRVTQALEWLVGAAARIEDAGRLLAAGTQVDPEYMAKARESVERADLRLGRMGYPDGRRLRERLTNLVLDRYHALSGGSTSSYPQALARLSEGFVEFRGLLLDAPPV